MRKKKVLGMMLSFTLAFGLALPVSLAMPIESSVVATASNATEKTEIATNSNASEDKKVITESGKRKEKEDEVIATDSNATMNETTVVATDSNATMVASEHLETCVEGCTGEDCECLCHVPSLFERLMATETIDEFEQIVNSATYEEIATLSATQIEEINVHLNEIEPEPLPEIIIEDPVYEIIQSEIDFPTVSFSEVAPLGKPVIGE